MPDDADVKCIWDGEARSSVSHVWLSNGGNVILCDVRDAVYSADNLPHGTTKEDGEIYWKSPSSAMEVPAKSNESSGGTMKAREEAARFVEVQFTFRGDGATKREKGSQHHYGKQEIRDLLDFIYGGTPATKADELSAVGWIKWS